jgi:hypothetical protein
MPKTYFSQAQGLEAHSPYELDILKNADLSIEIKEIAKIGTIIGTVACVVSPIFNYDLTTPLIVTSVSAIAWFGLHKLAQKLEPQAQSMIRELQERTPENQNNRFSFQFNSREEFNQSKQKLLGQLIS